MFVKKIILFENSKFPIALLTMIKSIHNVEKIQIDQKCDLKIKKESKKVKSYTEDAKELYMNEKYLKAVKLLDKSADSKSIVDRPTKKPLREVLEALNLLDQTNVDEIKKFVNECLHEPGFDIIKAEFKDWTPTPKFIDEIKSEELKRFSYAINEIWRDLYKKFDSSILKQGAISSHIPMKHPFIVPGGRFIETYYWDNFWILEGINVSGMYETSKSILENHIFLIDEYGFVPNGSRIYYLSRSQPPYFSLMVMSFYESISKSTKLTPEQKQQYKKFVLDECLDRMIIEHKFWMRERSVKIKHNQMRGSVLNIFNPNYNAPRVESYTEDVHTARKCKTDKERSKLYRNLSAAAESGIDFSTRWFRDINAGIETIQTSDIIPVDLNSVLYKVECSISKLCKEKSDFNGFKKYKNYSARRACVINSLMWSDKLESWCDYNYVNEKLNDGQFYFSNLSPLFFDIKPPCQTSVAQIVNKNVLGLDFDLMVSGIPYSMIRSSNEQWDFNVWAPNQHEMIMMLLRNEQHDLAKTLAKRFFKSVYTGWKETGMIFEKYSVCKCGEKGGQGEYVVQSGFGWTNGFILKLIDHYKDDLIARKSF